MEKGSLAGFPLAHIDIYTFAVTVFPFLFKKKFVGFLSRSFEYKLAAKYVLSFYFLIKVH